MAGVMSTSTDAEVQGVVEHTARVGMEQVIVDPCTAPQLPVPTVTLAVGVDASPVVGKFTAVNVTWDALSGPVLVMLKVNATCVPAATGFGDGLVLDGATVSMLLAPI